MKTFGPAYKPALDGKRLATQMERIRDVLLYTSQWLTLGEISRITGDHEASISAQLRHLRKRQFGSYIVEKRRRGDPTQGLWEYSVRPQPPKLRQEMQLELVGTSR